MILLLVLYIAVKMAQLVALREAPAMFSRYVWSDSRKCSCSEFVKFWQYWSLALNSAFNVTPQKEELWSEAWEVMGGNGRTLYYTALNTPVIVRCGTL